MSTNTRKKPYRIKYIQYNNTIILMLTFYAFRYIIIHHYESSIFEKKPHTYTHTFKVN